MKTKLYCINEGYIEYSKDFQPGFILYPCDLKLEENHWKILQKVCKKMEETRILIRLIEEGIDKISEEGSCIFSPNISYENMLIFQIYLLIKLFIHKY